MNIHIYDLREPSLYTHSNGVVCLTCRDGDPVPAPTLPVVHLWFKDAPAALAFLDACRVVLEPAAAPLPLPRCEYCWGPITRTGYEDRQGNLFCSQHCQQCYEVDLFGVVGYIP